MPGALQEAAAIFQWLANEISPDTYVNIMGQYRPAYQVGERSKDGSQKYLDIHRAPARSEMDEAYAAAREAGLWRFDTRAHAIV